MMYFYIAMGLVGLILVFGDYVPWLTGFRTLIKEAIVAVVGALMVFDWATIFDDPRKVGYAFLTVAVIGALARIKTTTRIGG